jgi:hypothetical protein
MGTIPMSELRSIGVGAEPGPLEDLHDDGGFAMDVPRHRQRMFRSYLLFLGCIEIPVGGMTA